MKATYIVTVEIADAPFEGGDDRTRGDLEFAVGHWITDSYGEPAPEFQHNAVTSVAVTRVLDESDRPEWHHVIGDDPCAGEIFADAAGEYGICDDHDRRVKKVKR